MNRHGQRDAGECGQHRSDGHEERRHGQLLFLFGATSGSAVRVSVKAELYPDADVTKHDDEKQKAGLSQPDEVERVEGNLPVTLRCANSRQEAWEAPAERDRHVVVARAQGVVAPGPESRVHPLQRDHGQAEKRGARREQYQRLQGDGLIVPVFVIPQLRFRAQKVQPARARDATNKEVSDGQVDEQPVRLAPAEGPSTSEHHDDGRVTGNYREELGDE